MNALEINDEVMLTYIKNPESGKGEFTARKDIFKSFWPRAMKSHPLGKIIQSELVSVHDGKRFYSGDSENFLLCFAPIDKIDERLAKIDGFHKIGSIHELIVTGHNIAKGMVMVQPLKHLMR